MKYMLMLYEPDTDWDAVPRERLEAALAEHNAWIELLKERGIEHYGAALRPSSTATTLRVSGAGDEMVVTDGPYVELKEHIGGFYVIDVQDLDEALELAKRCPTGTGTEVRPIWG